MSREVDLRDIDAYVKSVVPTSGLGERQVLGLVEAQSGNYIQRALEHVQGVGDVLGLEATQPSEFAADPQPQRTTSGAVAVHLQQRYKSIPIFQATQTVSFDPSGSLEGTAGYTLPIADDVTVAATLSAEDAVLRAAQFLASPQEDEAEETDQFGEPLRSDGVDLTGFVPRVLATFPDLPSLPTVLEAGPFAEVIKASLIWSPRGSDLRLAWEVILTMPSATSQYRALVDAQNGEILYCSQLVHQLTFRGNIHRVDGGQPREMVDFPLPLESYGLPLPQDLPEGFPDAWVDAASGTSSGNAVEARFREMGRTMRGSLAGDAIVFDPADPQSSEQMVLNIFYYNCFIHDFFYLLGFREADGNFQGDNFGRGGIARDRVLAFVEPGPVEGTAFMRTPVDGTAPLMGMGLVTRTNRHTAFDSSVIYHEFTHGVTNRLVGGPMDTRSLGEMQSKGMGEGWGDYIACIINDSTVVGAWVVNNAAGLRQHPYDSRFPDNFGHLGTGRYTKVHNIGEIWCATLMEMTRNIGKTLAVQLVVDALKLSLANPSFLDMRDAILQALAHKVQAGQISEQEHATALGGIWRAFAKFGMGPAAQSKKATLAGIVADFNLPQAPADDPLAARMPDERPQAASARQVPPTVPETGAARRLRRRRQAQPEG